MKSTQHQNDEYSMKIPKSFTINSQLVRVVTVDKLPGESFGNFDAVLNTITLADRVAHDDTIYELTEDQKLNTFFHEMLHAFQWYSKGEFSEQESSTYASYLVEFFKSMEQ